MSKEIKLYNTKTRSLETFTPIHEGSVGIYSCGPTVYHYAHIGNLRAYVFADILNKTLSHSGLQVRHVINITDVGHLVSDGDTGQDKLEKGAAREGKNVWEVAEFYTNAFLNDLEHLNISKNHYTFPRATDHIEEQIALIQELEAKGFTYTISDGVYFDTSKFEDYRNLARLDIEGLKSGARIEENKEKKNITDFALWKFSPKEEKRQMEWDSPWGVGFPGWHIECSAMAMKYLGEHFDIHTGGVDHIPVHHTNEIAQSECATGKHYVNYWMHVNFLNDTTGKMAKSNDDFLTLTSLIQKGYDPLAYRYFLLTTHYRKEVTFSYEALDAAGIAYKKLTDFAIAHSSSEGTSIKKYKEEFESALYNDLNTSEAVATLWQMIKDDEYSFVDRYITLIEMGDVLGFPFRTLTKKEVTIPDEVQKLLEEREEARKNKDFTASDKLRDEIATLGFIVKDTPNGQEVEGK